MHMRSSIYASMPAVPAATAVPSAVPKASAAPFASSIYSSMMNVPSSSMYASHSAAPLAPSMYASMPVAPTLSAPPIKETKAPVKEDFPSLPDGYSTVGLMLWPGKEGELLVTGFMEGHNAEHSGLETGDVIIQVEDQAVESMAASEVANRMAGPTGSSVTVTTLRTTNVNNEDGTVSTTKSKHTAVIIRDVSSDEANKKTQESLESTGISQNTSRPMTPAECMQYGVPFGSSWGPATKPKSAAAASKPKPAPQPASAAAPEGRLLTHQECMMFRVPYGSRIAAPKPKAPEPELGTAV